MDVLDELLTCFRAWEPDACVVGNVRAKDAIEALTRLRAENEGLKKLLAQCLPQVRGNRGAWLQFRDDHTHPTALAVADERISECDALLRHVDHALAAKGEG